MTKILVVGKGGREHALVETLAASPSQPIVYAFPGSDAIFQLARRTPVKEVHELPAFMLAEKIDLCIAGEESALVAGEGIANLCEAAGIPCWGPHKQSAQLEASKEFAKQFLARHRIPTASYVAVDSLESARAAITKYPVVLKFDGLAAGKGVVVCQDEAEAMAFLETVFVSRQFGPGRMVIEECLSGPEISIFCSICDDDYHILCPARDYKRIFDGDQGPNTGGMGAVASPQLADPALMLRVENEIVRPTVKGLRKDGLPYRGFIYFGLMLTADGPKVIEYNCRFGDPECEAVMPLLEGDFASYVYSAACGKLRPDLIHFADAWSVCLILASAGYPASSRQGDVISGLDKTSNVRVFHCGTKKHEAGNFVTNGGRVLALVGQGCDRATARAKVYAAASQIRFDGMQQRSDIAVSGFDAQP